MAHLASRFYAGDRDLDRMLALVSASTRVEGVHAGHLHRGDVVWGLFPNPTIDPSARVRLFEDAAGELRGFIWLHPPMGFGIHVNASLPHVALTIREMVDWAESHLGSAAPDNEAIVLEVEEVSSADARLQGTLSSLGYRASNQPAFLLNVRELTEDIEAASLPAGTVVRPVNIEDSAEVESRVALHRAVWEPSRFTRDGYEHLWTRPVYRPDLDLVAVTPDGELASYCIVWWDEATRTGEFEPVGTASRFRRQGYGKALMLEGMRRLRLLGASDALVISSAGPEGAPARHLYGSTGFETVTRFTSWERTLQD